MMCLGVLGLGIAIAFLIAVGFGTDTFSFLNNSLSSWTGLTVGTTMVLSNIVLFIAQLVFGRHLIGIGSIVNMLLVGPVSDLTTFLLVSRMPQAFFTGDVARTVIFILALALFLFSAALYMNAELGLAPSDAVATMLSERTGKPFFAIRMLTDACYILIGLASGGKISVGTVAIALTLGPAVSLVGRLIKR